MAMWHAQVICVPTLSSLESAAATPLRSGSLTSLSHSNGEVDNADDTHSPNEAAVVSCV